MRLVWTTSNVDHVRAFSDILKSKNIQFSIEERQNRDWSSDGYGNKEFTCWIIDEDQVAECMQLLHAFLENPSLPNAPSKPATTATQFIENKLHHTVEPEAEVELKETDKKISFSLVLLFLCSVLFLFDMAGERALENAPTAVRKLLFTTSPVKKALLYDYPESNELLDKIVVLYGIDSLTKPQDLPKPGQFLYAEYQKEPIFQGFYPYFVAKAQDKNVRFPEVKLFEKEKEGQIWRLVTPVLLHNDILHIFFNMLWLLLLSPQMEERLGGWKLCMFMIIVAVISNTAQYLMSGPHFLGISGIISAQVFFIRKRQSVAPWEGYLLTKSTFMFIAFFIGILAVLSFAGFIAQAFFNTQFSFAIANTAHLVGALVGYLLGRMKLFSER